MKNTSDTDLATRGDDVLSGVQSHVSRLTITHAKGIYMYTPSGRKIIDLAAGIAVTSTGHCHPAVVRAIQSQAKQLIHACAGIVYYDGPIQLAEALQDYAGLSDYQFFFTQSGTESIEAALKLARYVSRKNRFLAFKGGFHGRSLGAVAISSNYHSTYQPLMGPVDFLPYPTEDNAAMIDDQLETLRTYIKRHQHDLAGIIIEPMLGEGGYIPAPAAFLTALNDYCKHYSIYLIVDEIQTGIGRSGNWFAFQHYGLDPDIITIAKGLGSGMPIGAMAAKTTIMNQWKTGSHGGTYCGNPVCAQAAIATVDIVNRLMPRITDVAAAAVAYLKQRLGNHPHISSIRHLGLMIGITCVVDRSAYRPYPAWVKAVLAATLERDVLVIACSGHIIRIMPPLIITETQLMAGLSVLCDVLDSHR